MVGIQGSLSPWQQKGRASANKTDWALWLPISSLAAVIQKTGKQLNIQQPCVVCDKQGQGYAHHKLLLQDYWKNKVISLSPLLQMQNKEA